MAGHTIYYLSDIKPLDIEIDESDYSGRIKSTVPDTERPNEDGQANFAIEKGAPYVEHENGIVAMRDGAWAMFVTEDDFIPEDIMEANVKDAYVAVSVAAVIEKSPSIKTESRSSGIAVHEDDEFVYIATPLSLGGSAEWAVSFGSGAKIPASVVLSDPQSFLEILAVPKYLLDADGVEWKLAKLGDSSKTRAGDNVAAVSLNHSPVVAGEREIVFYGHISNPDEQIEFDGASVNVLEMDFGYDMHGGGGALVNARGEVIGMLAFLYAPPKKSVAQNSNGAPSADAVGYCIPINAIKALCEDI